MATKVKRPRISWSEEDCTILEEIVANTKTRSGVPMLDLLNSTSNKNNHKLSV